MSYSDFLDRLIDLALEEDLGAVGDVTTNALVGEHTLGRAELWAKEKMVLSGSTAFERVFQRLDPSVKIIWEAADQKLVGPKTRVAKLQGALRTLLVAERTALNLIQRACGIATLAYEASAAVKGTSLRVLDTRKTTPGLRGVSKQAVRDGGAHNHRFGLFDGVLIKDNHIAAVGGSVRKAIRLAKANAPRLVKIEVEVTTLKQLREALEEGVDVIMLDNMTDELITQAVAIAAGRVELEVSGGITLERLPKLAALGIDYVSMGALTHSARAMDLSLEIVPTRGR